MNEELEIEEMEPSISEEQFNDYDEPIFNENEELEMYGEIPVEAVIAPQTHGVEENYEVGDTYIQEE